MDPVLHDLLGSTMLTAPTAASSTLSLPSTDGFIRQKIQVADMGHIRPNYRQEKAATQDNNWSQIDTAIYTQCFMTAGMAQEDWCSSCNTLDHNSNNCPRNPPPPKRHKPQDGGLSQKTCDAYNAKVRFCTRPNCRFLHACQQCRGIHPLYRCPKQSSKGGSKRNPE